MTHRKSGGATNKQLNLSVRPVTGHATAAMPAPARPAG
jgi:hypothetical protein